MGILTEKTKCNRIRIYQITANVKTYRLEAGFFVKGQWLKTKSQTIVQNRLFNAVKKANPGHFLNTSARLLTHHS